MNAKIVAVFCMVVVVCMAQERQEYRDFSYNYEVTDEDGNVHSESRSQDRNGVVTGTMLIQLLSGIFRNARYEATPTGGFTITIDSNEPGMGAESPASATFNVQEAPAGSYDPPRRRV